MKPVDATRGFLQEFREFAMRGNVIDLAIGVILGAAFGAIVTSLVNDIIMPPLGLLLGDSSFEDLFITLSDGEYDSLAAAEAAGAATLNYGRFLSTLIDFVIIAFVIFLVVQQFNRLRREEEAEPTAPTIKNCPFCHTEIPVAATRCPNCTSQLEEGAATEATG